MGEVVEIRMRADRLHEKAQKLCDSGMNEEALRVYEQALQLDPARSNTLYNMGLIHKYRGNWAESFELNAKAYELAPDDEAARWNWAIAATALRRWEVARRLWADNGINIEGQSGPIEMNFGLTPIRLNAESDGEVVWGRRIDPVRARIESVPFPESGFRYADIVLHDGAPVGYRMLNDSKRGVFNVLELFEPSAFSTYVVIINVGSEVQLQSVLGAAVELGVGAEDWTANIAILCKQCSEGTPHEHHDTALETEWKDEHRIGVATDSERSFEELISKWKKSVQVLDAELALKA
jgi:hypothetical protein